MSGSEMVPLRSADREAVGSYTVCLYQPFSWPQMNQGPYFLHRPPRRCAAVGSLVRNLPPSSSSSSSSSTIELHVMKPLRVSILTCC